MFTSINHSSITSFQWEEHQNIWAQSYVMTSSENSFKISKALLCKTPCNALNKTRRSNLSDNLRIV